MTTKNHTPDAPNDESLRVLRKSNSRLQAGRLGTLVDDPARFAGFSREFEGLMLDFSRVNLDAQALDELLALAEQRDVAGQRDALFAGEHVNQAEDRPALHMALRSDDVLHGVGGEEADRVEAARQHMLELAASLHQGHLPGEPAERVRHIVHVGIGGSLLGTRLVCEALDQGNSPLEVHFLGSVGAELRERLMARLDPAETVVVMVSKSFTTGDTLLHGKRLERWLKDALGEEAGGRRFFAVTSQPQRSAAMGIPAEHTIYFPEWVGGRFSLWSPVSLSAAALLGPDRFRDLLGGAGAMDRHFREAPLADNLPVLFALTGYWHRAVCGYPAWGVMPYDQRLRLLPAFLQQLIMESNGKSVAVDGQPVAVPTAPVVFGETGTEAQHSVFQALHQGVDIVPLNFIGMVRPAHNDREAHDELLANLIAQLKALAEGRSLEETRAVFGDSAPELLPQRAFAGNRPSELLLLDELNPHTLGLLLALYEHKVFVESVLCGINAFDQWGVELGKTLAPAIQQALETGHTDDSSLKSLLAHIESRR